MLLALPTGNPLVMFKDKWIAPISDFSKSPLECISLTMPIMQAVANVTFIANGERKAKIVAKVFGEKLPMIELLSLSAHPLNEKLLQVLLTNLLHQSYRFFAHLHHVFDNTTSKACSRHWTIASRIVCE